MMEKCMKVSVLTPTYNDEITIKETAKSLISQTYTDWEWIVVNDGSTDSTDKVMQQIIEQYSIQNKCIYLKQQNGDQLNALLHGCEYMSGDYVFILHSDDLLPSNTFFQECVEVMQKEPEVDGLFGDLVLINEYSEKVGLQRVEAYKNQANKPAEMLLWLGRNLYADVAFHKTEVFQKQIKENYLIWNMPFWLYYDARPQMLRYKKVEFPILKYRVHGGNYINSQLGLHNVLNGELRTAIRLMHYYNIADYNKQYLKYRFLNKIGMRLFFRLKYKNEETINKAEVIDFIIKKRLKNYDDQVYFYSVYQFYNRRTKRVLDLSRMSADIPIYYGKDVRAFNKKLLSAQLEEDYMWFMEQMQEGFNQVINYEQLGTEKVKNILRFFDIEEEVKL